MATRRPLVGAIVALAALAVGLAAFHSPILRSVGAWLHVEGRPERADAIVVLAGGTPWREATAAELWKQGWAPRIIISKPFERPELDEMLRLGIRQLDLQGEARLALEKYGVPANRIVAIRETSRTTEPELRLVYDAVKPLDYRRLIFVTSPEHTRRVRLIWSRQAPAGPQGIVVAAREEFPFGDWWRRRRAAESVLHEYLGLLAIALGISDYLR
jgi:uncharacterized SAM-binding protein YcdF (DUF218 family)